MLLRFSRLQTLINRKGRGFWSEKSRKESMKRSKVDMESIKVFHLKNLYLTVRDMGTL
jgi:hypothetical protein